MASTFKQNEKGGLRVNISKKEIANWVGEDVPQSMVQHWLELGRNRAETEVKFDEFTHSLQDQRLEIEELKDQNRKLMQLLSQTAHLLCAISTSDHYELENLRNKSAKGIALSDLEKAKLNTFKVKDFNFKRYLSILSPGIESDKFLSLKQED